MKIAILLSVIALTYAYTDINDDFDINGLINDPVALKMSLDCLMDRGPCSSVLENGKRHTPETFMDACAECDDAQKHMYHLYLVAIFKTFPEEAKAFVDKYDTDGKHYAILKSVVDKY